MDPKKMARSKRAASKRSKAKHSRYVHPVARADHPQQKDDSLPSNRERPDDDSDDESGEDRSKSAGADSSELLSKRAASQRSKAKHSRHAHPAARADHPQQKDHSLPSNWDRYDDHSDDESGEDYSELFSRTSLRRSHGPKRIEEPPEPEGMMAMHLSNGSGLYDMDSSYLEPASPTAEQQAAREVAELLTLDMSVLVESLSRVKVAERLFLEDEPFPEQDRVKDRVETSDDSALVKSTDYPSKNHERELRAGADTVHTPSLDPAGDSGPGRTSVRVAESSGNSATGREPSLYDAEHSIPISLPTADKNEKTPPFEMEGSELESVREPVAGAKFETTAAEAELDDLFNMLDSQGPDIALRYSQDAEQRKSPKFEATAAEAELDDLLNMLDSQGPGISLRNSQDAVKRKSSASNFSAPSDPVAEKRYSLEHQDGLGGSKSKDTDLTAKVEAVPQTQEASIRIKINEKEVSRDKESIAPALVLDDDFDSWLDSI